MDNLTHSLAGAVLGQMGLKTKTGLAMPTLIIAANLPDIDAVATLLGGHQHLALRRGITHGPPAMLILPIVLWAIMLAWDKWRPSEKRLPVHKGWLLALAYIGTLSHPALDWLNVYGIRLLEPFSSQWFYGDTLFIIDVWIWAALVIGVWLSIRRERTGQGHWQRPAWISFTAVCAYIFLNGGITVVAERQATMMLRERFHPSVTMPDPMVVASPVPIAFWQREILWRDDSDYGSGVYVLGQTLSLDIKGRPHNADSLTLSHVEMVDEDGPDYLFWSRMPVVNRDADNHVVIHDQRFTDPRVGDRFTLKTTAKP
jgi:inner membrane protein